MPKLSLYSAWMDTSCYLWALLLVAAFFALVYSIRKYLELENSGFNDEGAAEYGDTGSVRTGQLEADEDASVALSEPVAEDPGPAVRPEPVSLLMEEAPVPAPERPASLPLAAPAAAAAVAAASPAENFVRGIYEGISGLDARLKDIETSLSKGRSNNEFAVKFLEDIAADIDTLDKAKIKARLEFLLSDLKK